MKRNRANAGGNPPAVASTAASSPGRETSGWRLTGLAALALGALVAAVFWRAQYGGFLLWDDDINIRNNPHLWDLTAANLRWMFTDAAHMRRYVPLTWLNWAVEHRVFGLTPRSAHLGNLLLHGANTILLFLLVRTLLAPTAGLAANPVTPARTIAAALAAAAWAVHPLRVEPVAWASGRIYCLATFFLLLSLAAYLGYVGAPGGARRRPLLLGSALGAYLLSLLTYPLALTFVGVLVVLDVYPLRRFQTSAAGWRDARIWAEKAAFAAVAGAVGGITVWASLSARDHWAPPVSLAEFGVLPRIAQAFYLWAHHLWKPLWPAGLSPVYTTLVSVDPGAFTFVASALGVVVVTVYLVVRRRAHPGLLAIWLCYLGLLLPTLGWMEHPHYPSDRYSFLAHLPWAVGLGAVLLRTRPEERVNRPRFVPALLLVAACAGLASAQTRVWRNTETLFRHMIANLGEHPYRADIYRRLGDLKLDEGDIAAARQNYREALRINPAQAYAYFGLGRLAASQSLHSEAIEAFAQAVRLDPTFAEGYRQLGVSLFETDRMAEAATAFQHSVRLAPHRAEVHCDLAAALLRLGRAAEAVPYCDAAIRVQPQFPRAHRYKGIALAALGRSAEAAKVLERAVALEPESAETHYVLGVTLNSLGDSTGAARHLDTALRLRPDFPEARAARGTVSSPTK